MRHSLQARQSTQLSTLSYHLLFLRLFCICKISEMSRTCSQFCKIDYWPLFRLAVYNLRSNALWITFKQWQFFEINFYLRFRCHVFLNTLNCLLLIFSQFACVSFNNLEFSSLVTFVVGLRCL